MRDAVSQPQYVSMAWCLVKHRDSFTVYQFLYFNAITEYPPLLVLLNG